MAILLIAAWIITQEPSDLNCARRDEVDTVNMSNDHLALKLWGLPANGSQQRLWSKFEPVNPTAVRLGQIT